MAAERWIRSVAASALKVYRHELKSNGMSRDEVSLPELQ